jgi:hypothetical protein
MRNIVSRDRSQKLSDFLQGSTKDQELHTANIGYCLLDVEVDLSKYNDAKPSDESDDEGQPPYILKSLSYFLSCAELSE